MKLNVRHYNLRSTHAVDALIENGILALQPRLQIDEAHVRLECRTESSPAYGVRVHLVTPGPDVHAEGRDHTIQAAVRKVITQLESRLGWRERRQRIRTRSSIQAPAARARNSHAWR